MMPFNQCLNKLAEAGQLQLLLLAVSLVFMTDVLVMHLCNGKQ